jgi:hypothetical protein
VEREKELAMSTVDRQWTAWLGPVAVTLFALTIAGVQYRNFLADPRPLWATPLQHDRSAHYLSGLALAQAIAHGNVAEMWHQFDNMRVWGPLHAFLLVPIELIAGPDYRLGVLPSLGGWVLAMVFGYLLARRIAPWGGELAGAVTVLFIAASPAHRAFALDVMLESLGSGLSLACLYFYVALVQDRRGAIGWLLGGALALLFLEKYNYFVLVAVGLVAAELLRQAPLWLRLARTALPTIPGWLVGQACKPSNYLLAGLIGAAVGARVLQGETLRLFGMKLYIGGPANLLHAAWFVVTIRLLLWRRTPAAQAFFRDLGPWRGAVLVPASTIVVWFLMPKRLSYFLWYLTVTDQHRERLPFLHGAPMYLEAIAHGYHVALWAAAAVAGFALVGLSTARWWRPGGVAAGTFLVLSALLTFQHPNLRERFLHSWIAIGWVIAGVGIATMVAAFWRRSKVVNGFLSIAVVGTLGALLVPYATVAGTAVEGGARPDLPCGLTIADGFLPSLADVRQPTLLSNSNAVFFLSWTYRERYPHRPFATEIRNYGVDPTADRDLVRDWLTKTRSDAIVLIDIAADSPCYAGSPENRDYDVLRACLAETTTFAIAERRSLPDKVTITIWRRVSS